ncbi:MAG: NAD(P)H-dependent oxidoreductase [Anaerolineae bacterium]|nr:NAD(P)H-dependent oxidoreductase [Anaerolineae bacterium]
MNIGIIVYSLSGHTLTVATRLKEILSADGHEVTLERVETVGPAKPQFENAELKTKPVAAAYDALVFACPVRGGTIPSPMKRYLEQLPSLQGKQVACLVTHFFQREWGANQVLAAMQTLCESKGATVRGVGEVRWFSLHRKQQIAEVVEELGRLF